MYQYWFIKSTGCTTLMKDAKNRENCEWMRQYMATLYKDQTALKSYSV